MSLQTTGGKDELNIVCIQKSQRTSQDGTENVKTHNRTHNITTRTMVYL
jgi:hypothetical protein